MPLSILHDLPAVLLLSLLHLLHVPVLILLLLDLLLLHGRNELLLLPGIVYALLGLLLLQLQLLDAGLHLEHLQALLLFFLLGLGH